MRPRGRCVERTFPRVSRQAPTRTQVSRGHQALTQTLTRQGAGSRKAVLRPLGAALPWRRQAGSSRGPGRPRLEGSPGLRTCSGRESLSPGCRASEARSERATRRPWREWGGGGRETQSPRSRGPEPETTFEATATPESPPS